MDIVVTTIKQIGREIMLDGNSLIGYQHSANLFIKLIKDTSESNPFAGMVLSAYCSSWKSDMPIVCPLLEKEDGSYILLPEGIFDHEGDVYLSLAAINEDKIVITSNQLTLQVDESNRIVSKVSPSEKYWEIEVLNAMKVWYANVVDPTFNSSNEKLNQLIRRTEEHEEKAEDLQKKAEEQQTAVDQSTAAAEQAAQSANTAATNANEKAAAANTAAQAADTAKAGADRAKTAANKATEAANTAAGNANTKAEEAAAAASEANAARDSANTLTQTVQQKLANGDFNGRTTYNGSGEPAVVLGKDGDTYLNKSNEGEHPKWLYLKENGKWTPLWNTQGIDGTDTVPVGAGYLISGDTVPPGYKEVAPPFSNPNLLINERFEIWQRGLDFNPAPSVKYTADRWLLYNSDTCRMYYAEALKKGYVDNKGNVHIKQYVEKDSKGDIYTMYFSYRPIATSLDKIISVTGTMSETAVIKENDDVVIKFGYDDVRKCQYVDIGFKKITEYQLNYTKLEYGKIATPLASRPSAEELMLCQRYFKPLDVATPIMYEYGNDSNGYAYLIEPRFAKMRATPSIASDMHFNYYDGAGNNVSGICVSAQAYNGYLTARTSAGGARLQNHCFGVKIATTLDAEIY